jgi:hypothetical protein
VPRKPPGSRLRRLRDPAIERVLSLEVAAVAGRVTGRVYDGQLARVPQRLQRRQGWVQPERRVQRHQRGLGHRDPRARGAVSGVGGRHDGVDRVHAAAEEHLDEPVSRQRDRVGGVGVPRPQRWPGRHRERDATGPLEQSAPGHRVRSGEVHLVASHRSCM